MQPQKIHFSSQGSNRDLLIKQKTTFLVIVNMHNLNKVKGIEVLLTYANN